MDTGIADRGYQKDAAQDGRPPVLSVSHDPYCGVWLGHYSRASEARCTCSELRLNMDAGSR